MKRLEKNQDLGFEPFLRKEIHLFSYLTNSVKVHIINNLHFTQ